MGSDNTGSFKKGMPFIKLRKGVPSNAALMNEQSHSAIKGEMMRAKKNGGIRTKVGYGVKPVAFVPRTSRKPIPVSRPTRKPIPITTIPKMNTNKYKNEKKSPKSPWWIWKYKNSRKRNVKQKTSKSKTGLRSYANKRRKV